MNKYKRDEIEILIEDYNIDIIAMTESWTNGKIEDAEISFSGFTCFLHDRSSCSHKKKAEEYFFL